MKKQIILFLILFVGFEIYSQRGITPIEIESGNYLTFTPVNQTVSGNSGEDIFAQVLVNCYGASSEAVMFNINFCSVDGGYQTHYTNNGTILYPGQNSTITFKFKKTVTTSSSFEYIFRKDNGNCNNNSSLIKITVNYTASSTCNLTTPTPTISNITSGSAIATWPNIANNNGYTFSYRSSGQSGMTGYSLNQNQNSFTLNNLNSQTLYYYELRVKCSNGASSTPITGSFTTLSCNPPIPLLDDATEITQNSAKITWNNVEGNQGYRVYVKRNYETRWTYTDININTTFFTIPHLQWNTTYEYRIATRCTGNVGASSTIKTFTTLDSPSLTFPENVIIATINSDYNLEVYYPNGSKRNTGIYSKKIDVYNSELMVGLSWNNDPIIFSGSNSSNFNNINYSVKPLPFNLWAKDISIGKPYKYNNINYNAPVTYAIGSDNLVYYALTGTTWYTANINIQSGPWTGQLKSIEAVSYYGFYLMDSNRNCVRCDRNFINPNAGYFCYIVSNYNGSNEAIGAAFENYNENPPTNTPSFYNAMYRVENNNTITYHYNFGDNESLQIPKPTNEPDYCSNCSIDGFMNNYGQPSNLAFLPNNDGYYYDGTNWILVAQNIKDISIGQFNETIGYRTSNNVKDKNLSKDIEIENNSVTISPVPASENINININDYNVNKKTKVTLLDNTGKRLLSLESMNKDVIDINLIDYVDGIYLLKIEFENETITKKVVIKH